MGGARLLGRFLGALLSISLLLAAGYYWQTFRNIQKNVKQYDIAVGNRPTKSNGSTAPDFDGKDLNILLVGNDDRSNMTNAEVRALKVGRDGGSLATDTMMIVHVPADGSKATLISLPRDTVVDIPDGYRRNKLNSPYASAYVDARNNGASTDQARLAGANLLVKTITDLTGLTINHYVQIDLLGFYRISKAIGGVPVNLCNNVSDPVIPGEGGSGLKLSKGYHKISGVQALEFVRQRHNLPHGDFDRVRRQQYFLTSAFRQVASVGILTKLKDIGDAVTSSLYVDKGFNILDIARQLEHLTANNIIGRTIPTYTDADGNITADPAKVQKFIANLFAKQTAKPTTSPGSPTVTTGPTTPAPSGSTSTAPIDSKCIN